MLNVARRVLVILAISFVLGALYLHFLVSQVKSWPTVTGQLEEKGIVGYGAGSDGAAGSTDDYAIYVRYSYRVGDRRLTGTRVRVWDATFSYRALAEDYLKDHQAGAAVRVFYNPANPEQAYLSTAYPIAPVCMLLLGAAISAGVALFWQSISRFLRDWSMSSET